ncbi:hypothetical protein, partial [Mesobacillus boroniphilus]|uniref:hypothetical protein n=1 Tax=Mesobacillus boroniphilus TaxID=308892 RepID=UPI000A666898
GLASLFFMQLDSAQIPRKPLYFYFAINTSHLKLLKRKGFLLNYRSSLVEENPTNLNTKVRK